ncbi:MAG: hypothetical protein B7Y84_12495 [Azorhizobium sp. 32-67-21]|nr:MAG: hypothetical protein B7Y84_12495 [Azorhizobium sp. 32-67-21]
MRIATWNVNSIRQRLDHAVRWLKEAEPDVVCLQEIKCQDEAFPREAFEAIGYNVEVHGQKGFNGVALLSKLPLEDVTRAFILAGDFNVIPTTDDAADPAAWVHDALFLPPTRTAFRDLIHLGLTDAVRATTDSAKVYSFWDYQAGAWQRDLGIRIDHLLLSPQAADRLIAAGVDKHVRGWEKPSDHVPVWVDLSIAA